MSDYKYKSMLESLLNSIFFETLLVIGYALLNKGQLLPNWLMKTVFGCVLVFQVLRLITIHYVDIYRQRRAEEWMQISKNIFKPYTEGNDAKRKFRKTKKGHDMKKQIYVFIGQPETGKSILAWELIDYGKADLFDPECEKTDEGFAKTVRKIISMSEKEAAVIVLPVLDDALIEALKKDGHKVTLCEFRRA